MITLLYQWLKSHKVLLINALSLFGTTAVTSGLGFIYWWVAAQKFPPEAVGLGSAAISTMMLLGTFCVLGLGTLLIGELARQPGKEGPLISAALILVGGVGGCSGIAFAVIAPLVSTQFQQLRASVEDVILFAVGISLTALTLVLDQALIGLLRSELQLWRNTLFAAVKLVALVVAGFWLAHKVGITIYATWAVGNIVSLAALASFTMVNGRWSKRTYRPEWGLLRKLRIAALQHHIFNLILVVPAMTLPVLVTILLSATVNAWFYVALMLANFVFLIPATLTTVLYAASSVEPVTFVHKTRLTLGLSTVICLLASCLYLLATKQILSLFGHAYAEEAAWSLRILILAAFPLIIKCHFVALCRTERRIARVLLPMMAGGLLELIMSALGARFYGLPGLSLGWVVAVCIESMFMIRRVYRVIRPINPSATRDQLQHTQNHNNVHTVDVYTNEPSFRQ